MVNKIGNMPKFILLMMTATCLVLGLACSTANSPATSGQQPDSIAGDSAGTEPTETSPSGGTSDRSGRVPEQTIAVLGQGESTDSPRRAASSRDSDHDSEAEVQTGMSSFQDEIGREYPGLLSLPECSSDTQLTMAPLQDDAYQVIIPLGLLSTPQHVLPTSHVYYHLVRETIESGGYGPPAVAEVRAPGDIRVLRVNSSESIKGPRGPYIDYDITFAPCRGMMYQFLHVSTLIPRLEKLFVAGLTGRCDEYGDEQSQYRLCQSSVQMDLPVGTLMGTTGGKVSAALDLEAYDLDGPSLSYANSAQFGSPFDLRLKVTCPFDGFTAEVEQQQLARMGDYDLQPRTAEPRCGEVMQDIPILLPTISRKAAPAATSVTTWSLCSASPSTAAWLATMTPTMQNVFPKTQP